MTDDAKKLDEWKREVEERLLRVEQYHRRLVVEDARPPEPVDDGLEEDRELVAELRGYRGGCGRECASRKVPLTQRAAGRIEELASRGLEVRPVVEMTEAELIGRAWPLPSWSPGIDATEAMRRAFAFGGGKLVGGAG